MTKTLLKSSCIALALLGLGGCALALPPLNAAPDTRMGASGRSPAWLEGAVIYGAVPPLFGHAPLQDLTARLDQLKDLGIDAMWLSPINETDDPSSISYAITDYLAIRKDFGTEADFKRLIAEAHRRNIKVLMDFVPNHSSTGHPFYKDALANGPQSPTWGFYVRDKNGNAQHYFNWETLKNLNYGNKGVRSHMTEAFSHWVKLGVDGFRVDAAWGIKDRSPDYWPELSKTLHAINPQVFMLAEASARDPYYVRNGFNAAYDWTEKLGHWSWENVWKDPKRAGERLRTTLGGRETPPEQIARFINNNDTGTRFHTKHGVPLQKVAAALVHTLPGIPTVYTGEEVGAEFEPYEDPPPISWEDPHGLRPYYKTLIGLRGSLPALRTGTWIEARTPKHPGAYAFVRDAGSKGYALVVLNFSTAGPVDIEVPARFHSKKLKDRLSGQSVALQSDGKTLSVPMSATSARILTP